MYKHLTYTDRLQIEVLLRGGHKPAEIAKLLGVHTTTIYREKKRGAYIHTNSDLTEEVRYSPQLSHNKYLEHLKNKGGELKIGKNYFLAEFLEKTIEEKNYSPGAALAEAKRRGFQVTLTRQTIYSYINKGVLLVDKENLPMKGKTGRRKKVVQVQKRASQGTSIEKRAGAIKKRSEFGHWEMDTVVGKRTGSLKTLLVLTERKTRHEIIRVMPDRTTKSVVRELNKLERVWGKSFTKLFKTITVDNGVEFSDVLGLESSVFRKGKKRTQLYYCHAYASYERGSNEHNNRFIRRRLPKGTDFQCLNKQIVQEIEDWMNDYPREILGWRSSREMFEIECQKLIS